ncbi:MAG: AAA family ATPase [Actinobacteria bacterium]|nr:AAA family ATPase [Actinomycetota bacterium]
MVKKIIGLTGPIRAGKSSVLQILEKKGYKGYKFSEVINKEIIKRGQTITRELEQDVGNELRAKFGGNYWAKELLEHAEKDGSDLIVIDGIRNPEEIKYLKEKGAFILGINADYEVRRKRFLENSKESDLKNSQDFEKINNRDSGLGEDSFGQQVGKSLKMADIVIVNNSNLLELRKKIEEILGSEKFLKAV